MSHSVEGHSHFDFPQGFVVRVELHVVHGQVRPTSSKATVRCGLAHAQAQQFGRQVDGLFRLVVETHFLERGHGRRGRWHLGVGRWRVIGVVRVVFPHGLVFGVVTARGAGRCCWRGLAAARSS